MATQTKAKPKPKPKLVRRTVERGALSAAEQKKLDAVLGNVLTSFKLSKADAVATGKQLARFGKKYLLNKLGRRGTGPHAHGFNAEQRKAIISGINAAFGIKAPERKVRVRGATTAKKGGAKNSRKKTTAQLAKEQTARAQGAGQPIPGTVVLVQGS